MSNQSSLGGAPSLGGMSSLGDAPSLGRKVPPPSSNFDDLNLSDDDDDDNLISAFAQPGQDLDDDEDFERPAKTKSKDGKKKKKDKDGKKRKKKHKKSSGSGSEKRDTGGGSASSGQDFSDQGRGKRDAADRDHPPRSGFGASDALDTLVADTTAPRQSLDTSTDSAFGTRVTADMFEDEPEPAQHGSGSGSGARSTPSSPIRSLDDQTAPLAAYEARALRHSR